MQTFRYHFKQTNHTYTFAVNYDPGENEYEDGHYHCVASPAYLLEHAYSGGVDYTEEQVMDRENIDEDALKQILANGYNMMANRKTCDETGHMGMHYWHNE